MCSDKMLKNKVREKRFLFYKNKTKNLNHLISDILDLVCFWASRLLNSRKVREKFLLFVCSGHTHTHTQARVHTHRSAEWEAPVCVRVWMCVCDSLIPPPGIWHLVFFDELVTSVSCRSLSKRFCLHNQDECCRVRPSSLPQSVCVCVCVSDLQCCSCVGDVSVSWLNLLICNTDK